MKLVVDRSNSASAKPLAASRDVGIVEGRDFAKVRDRVKRRLNWTESFAKAVEAEYRKFLVLTLINPETPYGMAGPVDEFWHDHILDTKNYWDMCDALGRMIHHVPGEPDEHSPDNYQRNTLPHLNLYFGIVSPVWPNQLGETCSRCSSCDSELREH